MAKKAIVLTNDTPIGNFVAKTNDQYVLDGDIADALVKAGNARFATADDLNKFKKSTLEAPH